MELTVQKRLLGTIPLLEVVQKDKVNEVQPFIVFYHGWGLTKELVLSQGRRLAKAGFRVILPDAANHGERKQAISSVASLTFWQSIHTNLFEFDYIINYFEELGVVDERIAIGGLSMGGITTCALLTNHPEIKAAACLMGTPKPVAYRDRIFKSIDELEINFPKDYENLLAWIPRYDLSMHPETLNKRPLLFWHGKQDEVIPYNDVVEFVKENPNQNITFIDEDEDHLVTIPTMNKVTDFFVKEML